MKLKTNKNQKLVTHKPGFVMEPYMSLGADGSVNLITAINYQEILLQNDHVSQVLHRKNPKLFNKLENLLEIDSIELKRKEILALRNKFNRLGTLVGVVPKASHLTETVLYTSSENGNILRKTKYILEDGSVHVVDPRKIQKASEGFIGDVITIDDLSSAFVHSSVEEVNLFASKKVKFLAFKDFSVARSGGSDYKYGLEITFSSKTMDLIRNVYKSLSDMASKVSDFHKIASLQSSYDYNKKAWKKDFFASINSASGFNVTRQDEKFNFTRDSNSISKNALWIKAPTYYCAGMDLLGKQKGEVNKKMFSLLNPLTSDPDSILYVHKMFENLISELRTTYSLEDDNYLEMSFKSFDKKGLKTRTGSVRTKHTVGVTFSDSINVRQPKGFGVKFIGIKKQKSFPFLSSDSFKKRVEVEKNKFFKRAPSAAGSEFDNLSVRERESLSNLDSAYSYFTPFEVILGKQRKQMAQTNEQIFDNNFFNQISLIKSSKHKKTKLDVGLNLSQKGNLDRVSSAFNFAIRPPQVSNVERPLAVERDFIDVREFLGENTSMASIEYPPPKATNPTLSKQEEEDTESLIANFAELKTSSVKTKNLSLKSFDLKDKDSNFRSFIGNKSGGRKLKNLPISVKALLVDTENDRTVRFGMVGGEFDPLRNSQTQEVIKENFLNIKKLEYLSGFKSFGGAIDLKQPIWKTMTPSIANKKNSYLCRLLPYENYEIGVTRSQSDLPVLDSLFIIRGKK